MRNFLFIAGLILCSVINAQNVSLGPKLGVNFTRFTGDLSETNFIPVGYFGAGLNLQLEENLALEGGLLLNQEGTDIIEEHVKSTVRTNYLSIPLMVKFFANRNIFLQLGFQPSFLVKASSKEGNEEVDIQDNLRSFDMGLNLGIGFYFTNSLFLDLKYYQGFFNVNKNLIPEAETISNQVISVGINYFFRLGKAESETV